MKKSPVTPIVKGETKTKKPSSRGKRSTPVAAVAAGGEETKVESWRSGARRRIKLETRSEMLERLTNPQISLHEAGVILRVCSATVRHYSDAGYLPHQRTPGGQRRFYLKEVLAFLREREAEKRKK